MRGAFSSRRPKPFFIAAIALVGFLLPATAVAAPAHCEGYNYEEFSVMAPEDRIAWFTEEIAQCDDPTAQAAAHSNRAFVYYEQGDFETALADYEQAMALDPNYTYARSGRAYSYYSMGRYDEAVAAFDEAIALDPNYVDAYNGRASSECFLDAPRTPRALEDILKAVELEPQWAIDWQAYLSTEGFYTGPISGDFDEATQAAFSAWCES